MNGIFGKADAGRKNIGFGIALFAIFGVGLGIPLTVDFLGGSLLTGTQYQTWKIIHAYGVFLAFVNYFFGRSIDGLNLTKREKEISSWSFLIAGLAGGVGRSALFLLSILNGYGGYAASLIETVGFVIGTVIFVRGQIKEQPAMQVEKPIAAASELI